MKSSIWTDPSERVFFGGLDAHVILADAIRAAQAEFEAALVGHRPRPIPLNPHALDLEARGDTVQNVRGGPDLHQDFATLSDLASDVAGTIQRAADDMAGRVA